MAARKATISRNTNETQIEVLLDLDWSPSSGLQQEIKVSTGIGFLDHVRSMHFKIQTYIIALYITSFLS